MFSSVSSQVVRPIAAAKSMEWVAWRCPPDASCTRRETLFDTGPKVLETVASGWSRSGTRAAPAHAIVPAASSAGVRGALNATVAVGAAMSQTAAPEAACVYPSMLLLSACRIVQPFVWGVLFCAACLGLVDFWGKVFCGGFWVLEGADTIFGFLLEGVVVVPEFRCARGDAGRGFTLVELLVVVVILVALAAIAAIAAFVFGS